MLGVLVKRSASEEKPLGRQTSFFRDLSRSGSRVGVSVVAIDPSAVDDVDGVAPGLKVSNAGWSDEKLSLPPYLFDRYIDPHAAGAVARRRLENRATIFNPLKATLFMADKLETARLVEGLRLCSVPETVTVGEIRSGDRNLKPPFVVKPRFGMASRGVRIVTGGDVTSPDVTSLPPDLETPMDHRDDYLVQQFVPGADARLGGDIRVLMQCVNGTFSCTGAYLKYKVDAPRTSLAGGARAMPLEEYCAVGGYDLAALEHAIERVGLGVAEAVRKLAPGVFEIGIDLVFDGVELWFLEANSKPARYGFKVISQLERLPDTVRARYAEKRARSVANVIDHVLWLDSHTQSDVATL